MSAIQVIGLSPLSGEVSIQGSKNAVLPMMAASLLHRGVTVLKNVPRLRDVTCMMQILEALGCRCVLHGDCLVLDASQIKQTQIPAESVSAMRSSIIVLGALLGRAGEAGSGYPGGCLIGARPIDLHLMALKKLGARFTEKEGRLFASCKESGGLTGAEIFLPSPSVGATEQALLAAVLAKEVTIIHGAAREPEIEQLCRFLNNMGAVICGGGTSQLMIQGVSSLHDSSFTVEGDRIVAGTYGAALMAAGGRAVFKGIRPSYLSLPLTLFKKAGASVKTEERSQTLEISMKGRPRALSFQTEPYPGFPTDLQSPFLAFLASACGVSCIKEQVFESRFAAAYSLMQMGADITIEERTAVVRGVYPLKGARVEAADLRGGAALVVAALAARGETYVTGGHHIRRGYEDICRDLSALGAKVSWIEE